MKHRRSGSAAKVLVFVPTSNDTELLGKIVVGVKRLSNRYTVLVLDDGSRAAHRSAIKNLDCLRFHLPDNLGLGACTQIAFDHALRHDYQAVVRVDADGQHPLERIPDLLALLEKGEADVVAGRRINHDEGTGARALVRRMVKSYFVAVAKMLTGGAAPNDVNTGFFAMNRHAVATINQHMLERFPEPQLFILACREKLRVMELPVEQIEREFGTSTVNLLQAAEMFYRFNMFVLGELLRGPWSHLGTLGWMVCTGPNGSRRSGSSGTKRRDARAYDTPPAGRRTLGTPTDSIVALSASLHNPFRNLH